MDLLSSLCDESGRGVLKAVILKVRVEILIFYRCGLLELEGSMDVQSLFALLGDFAGLIRSLIDYQLCE